MSAQTIRFVDRLTGFNKIDKKIKGRRTNREKKLQGLNFLSISEYSFFENAPIGIQWVDESGKVLLANKEALNMLGYSKEEYLGQNYSDFFVDSDICGHILNRLKKFGAIHNYGVKLKGKGGETRYVLISADTFKQLNNNLICARFFIRDITKRKITEEKLKKSEEQLRNLIENIHDSAICMLDQRGCISTWNEGVKRITGYEKDEIIHSNFAIFYPGELRGSSKPGKLLEIAFREGSAQHVCWMNRKDGSKFWADISLTALRNKSTTPKSYSLIFRDITVRRESEERINFQANILSQVNDAIVVLNNKQEIIFWNFGAELLFQVKASEALGLKVPAVLKYDWIKPLDQQELNRSLKTMGFWHGENIVYRRDEAEIYIESSISVLKNEDGGDEGLLAVIHDITERRRMEKRKDEFLGIASHELKTPVTSIKAFTQILKKNLYGKSDYASIKYLDKMDLQINKMTGLINNLLDVSKIAEGKLTLAPESFDIGKLVSEVCENLQLTFLNHKLIIKKSLSRPVLADKERLSQVLENLVVNAVKYSPESEMVEIEVAERDDEVLISVRDFGVGIARHEQKKIFEKFYRATREKDETYPGLGLGLHISSEIIKRHGGKIWVESKLNKGSTFYFSLPAKSLVNGKKPDNLTPIINV